MQNDEIAPVNHSTISATASTAAGVAGGALKTGAVSALGWIAALTIGGALLGFTIATGGIGGIAWGPVLSTVGLGGVGLVVGTLTSFIPGGLGALFGGISGGSRAAERVSREVGASEMMQAQVAAMQAQVMANAQTANNCAAASATPKDYGLPAYGTPMNTASPVGLQAGNDNMQYAGRVDGAELASARG